MLVFALFVFLSDLVVATNKVITITRYTTTTLCPITTTFTSSGVTVTTTKWTTSEVTVAVVQTVVVPGPTATHTQISVVNVTKILTSSDVITLPTVELTKSITTFATFVETSAAIIVPSSTSSPSTSSRTCISSSTPNPNISKTPHVISYTSVPDHTEESKELPPSTAHDNGETTSRAAVTSNQSASSVGSTTLYESQPPSLVVGIDTGSASQDRSVFTIVASTNTPAEVRYSETQRASPTGTRDWPNGTAKPVPSVSQPPLVAESIDSVEPTGSPVVSKGTMPYLPTPVWVATIACVVSGMVWGIS